MGTPKIIRLLAERNECGDLFTRLTKDLFFALGYDDLRLNISKAGREIDIQGKHRYEPRRILCECKAHSKKMGGAELNKFFGVLARERDKSLPTPVAGYFVSLGGFTETGIDQEMETGDNRVILLDACQVIFELERSRVVTGHQEALERAGHCAHNAKLQDARLEDVELFGHDCGYVWVIYYSQGKSRSHFALVHADGTPLASNLTNQIVKIDRACGGQLHRLTYLRPAVTLPSRGALEKRALETYRQWLSEECGYIQLDGLPADTDLSATKMRLEKLFVPLNATLLAEPPHPDAASKPIFASDLLPDQKNMKPIGRFLSLNSQLAILAAPGGGKSTLLKRLASAYAFPDRHPEVSDDLPKRKWLPLLMRCRELRDRAHRPILELLDDLPRYANLSPDEVEVFKEFVHESLRNGRVLLLVDGLDEISEEGDRQAFASHLRTFVAMFPSVALVLTSREAGFRLVAGVVASVCRRVRLAPLVKNDVQNLCTRWHLEVVGDTERVRTEACELGQTIWNNERMRPLATNPLLLTTLLVVKRWIGELPRSRAALYREAIRVLIRTWNVEGYAPLDEGETLAQLSFVACKMMEDGTQQIGQKELVKLLHRARQELEAELQFTRTSPSEFLERIEYRSSLLMQAGHGRIDDELQAVYEFRHLTFQEYLTARGYVEEQHPGRNEGHGFANILERHFKEERWCEVIPLATVLAGRRAEDIIKRLTTACTSIKSGLEKSGKSQVAILAQCLLDEVQVTSLTLRAAIQQVARHWKDEQVARLVDGLRHGKLANVLKEVAEDAFLNGGTDLEAYGSLVCHYEIEKRFGGKAPPITISLVDDLVLEFDQGTRTTKLYAVLIIRWLVEEVIGKALSLDSRLGSVTFKKLQDALGRAVETFDPPITMTACQALTRFGGDRLSKQPPAPSVIHSLYQIWRDAELVEVAKHAAWALGNQPLLPRNAIAYEMWGDCEEWLRSAVNCADRVGNVGRDPALVIGWYRRAPWADSELCEMLASVNEYNSFHPTATEILNSIGNEKGS